MNTLHCSVSGITDSQSKTKVKNALDKIIGIQQVSVDISRGTIEVQYNEPANPSEIKECIKNTGYDILS